jgi:hypothetical protein
MSFVHDDKDFGALVRIVADKRGLSLVLVEKDYWVTHTLSANESISPMFWGERIPLDEACATIRDWIHQTLERTT